MSEEVKRKAHRRVQLGTALVTCILAIHYGPCLATPSVCAVLTVWPSRRGPKSELSALWPSDDNTETQTPQLRLRSWLRSERAVADADGAALRIAACGVR